MRIEKFCCSALALIGLLLFGGAGAWAGDDQDKYYLGEIVVSGTREGVQAAETIRTVTSEDIRMRGARTLDEAIALLPGVSMRVGAEGVPRVDIRGFRTRHVVLLLDGIPMNSAFDQQFDPTLIPTENIAEIKLSAGASSVLYGQGGLGGVINIVTRKGTAGVQGMVAAEAGDHQPYLAKGSVSGASDRFFYFFGGQASRMDAFPLSGGFSPTSEQPAGYRKNSDRRRESVLGTVGFTPNADLSLGLTANYIQGSFGKPSSIINDPNDPFANTIRYARVDDLRDVSLQLAVDYAATERMTLRGWGFLNEGRERDTQFDTAALDSIAAVGSFRQNVSTSVRGVSLQPRYDLGRAGRVTLSLAGEWDSWRNSGPEVTDLNVVTDRDVRQSLALYSSAVEYEVSPLAGVGLTFGYSHFWQLRDLRNDDDYSMLTSATYDLTSDTRLKAAFKRNVRFPSLGDIYGVIGQSYDELNAEHSLTYEAGVEQKLPLNSRASVTGFHTRAKNLIQKDQATGIPTNLAEINFTGLEVWAESRPSKKLLVRASYAYLESRDKSRAGRDEQQYTPRDRATLEGRYDFDCGFTGYGSLLWVANQYFYTKNNVQPVQKAKLNDYGIVNVKFSQRLSNDKATLYVGAENLLDLDYETSYGFPLPGRFIYGGFEFRM